VPHVETCSRIKYTGIIAQWMCWRRQYQWNIVKDTHRCVRETCPVAALRWSCSL